MVTSDGHLYTCGAKENGKLGHGSHGPSGNLGRITRVTKFLDSDEQTDMDVKIGYVSHRTLISLFIDIAGGSICGLLALSDNVSVHVGRVS